MTRAVQDQTIVAGMRLYDGADYDTIVERVSYGGFGVIAFGPNRLRNNEMVAYKTLRKELLADRATYAGFVRECLLWIGMWPHPNIAAVYGVKEMGDARGLRPFIALHYAEHGSLRDLLTATQRQPGGRLPLRLGLELAQQIAAGLTYLHTPDPAYLRPEPTVHRDLKPENVLLMGDGRAVITDFGLAKIIEDASPETLVTLAALLAGGEQLAPDTATMTTGLHTSAGISMGTAAYMPPEQWLDARTAGPPADMYAFGIILSELLASRHALLDLNRPHTQEEWRAAHVRSSPRLLRTIDDTIPLAVETLYLRCLLVDPAARPGAAEALAVLQAGARAIGLDPYIPAEIVAHIPYNELSHWHQWSNACYSFERFEEALDRSDRALPLARALVAEQPDLLPIVLLTRGNIFMSLGKAAARRGDQAAAARWDAQAQAAFQESLSSRPPETTGEGRAGRAFVWRQIGVFHKQRERWAEAEAAYTQALALKPDMPDTYYSRANSLFDWGLADLKTGRKDEAEKHLRQARVCALTSLAMQYPPAHTLVRHIEDALRALGVS